MSSCFVRWTKLHYASLGGQQRSGPVHTEDWTARSPKKTQSGAFRGFMLLYVATHCYHGSKLAQPPAGLFEPRRFEATKCTGNWLWNPTISMQVEAEKPTASKTKDGRLDQALASCQNLVEDDIKQYQTSSNYRDVAWCCCVATLWFNFGV